MVIRKSSVPYPASPPPAPPEPPMHQTHLHVDSADVPPVPSYAQRSQMGSHFEEMGNPWQDDISSRNEQDRRDIPNLLRPGVNQTSAQSRNTPPDVPDVLKPGWSGEVTPRSSLDSDRSPEREWWDDEDEQKTDYGDPTDPGIKHSRELHVVNNTASPSEPAIQSASTVKRKPLPQSHSPAQDTLPTSVHQPEFASNNPFRRLSETHQPEHAPEIESYSRSEHPHPHPHPLRSSPSKDQLGRLALNDGFQEKEAIPTPPSIAPPLPPMEAPPPIPRLQEPLIPTQTGNDQNPWASVKPPLPSPSSFEPRQHFDTVPTDDLLDRGHHEGSLSLGEELRAIPNNPTAPRPSTIREPSLLENEEPGPPKPPRPVRQESDDLYAPPPGPPPSLQPPVKPPRPAVVTSERDLAMMKEQRNETYQIKHFNWYDLRTSRMRRSSMLTQNQNGPCPLLALVNAMILGATEEMQAALDEALRLREQVSLGLIIETLMDELLTRAAMSDTLRLPDVDELNRFLMRLRTGMNANPRFVPASQPVPNLMDGDTPTTPAAPRPLTVVGTFETTQDISLYSSFRIKLVHGWLPQPNDEASRAFARSAQTYEDAQAVQFGEEELEYKLSNGGLNQHEQQLWQDITSIKQFFRAFPTQLTPYGLGVVQESLEPGEFAILFRNDHFSTIYKNPRDQRLYTLVTDAGYADRDEIIWESLEDINGARTEHFSGDFHSAQLAPPSTSHTAAALTPQEQQEQADMDFAIALQMQEEEEQAQRRARNQQQNSRGGGVRPGDPAQRPRRSQGNIPIPLRSNPGGEVRPVIPPRNQNTNRNPAVNRPADADQVDAPPAYEEAAGHRPYVPPIGSPLHPSSSTDLPLGRASTSTSNVHAQGQTTGVTNPMYRHSSYSDARPAQHLRRTSAYGENTEYRSPDYPAGPFGPNHAYMPPAGSEYGRRRTADGRGERDCVVM
ncbi:hypothetical protein LTS08_000719 [Lithohypha guttulata]|nr:hypothetical protein LTS08_000719 [Lithohypha guttulata]